VGAGGLGTPYDAALDEVIVSYPAVDNVAGALRTFTPLAFGTAGNTTAFVDQGADVNLYTITMPVASTYCRLTLFFQAGTLTEDPIFYGQSSLGSGTLNPFVIYLSYLASTGTPPTNISIFFSPNSFVFQGVERASLDPVSGQLVGGTFMPNVTLEMTAPDPTNTWYVNMAHLGPVDPNTRVTWDFRAIAPSISTARLENVVEESVITPD